MRHKFSPKVKRIFSLLRAGGASEILVVGGYVRDSLLKLESKDIDIEVYGLSFQQISRILSPEFRVNKVGQSFGVLKIDNEIDIALPRRESKMGTGHKGFDVRSEQDLDPKTAFSRRDFTINAIGMREDGSIYDPYDGIGDMKRRVLRAVSPAFKDDPLRVLRGMQFSARFGFTMDEQTIRYCHEIRSEYSTLSPERIYEEWKKWALKGVHPDLGLETLRQSGWLDCFPELSALVGCQQNPQWHPEGDVWEHTKNVCASASQLIADLQGTADEFSSDERLVLMFAALGHDFGKPLVTSLDEHQVLRSLGHASAGEAPVRSFLTRLSSPLFLSAQVIPLVREHMSALNPEYRAGVSPRAVRRLACRLSPSNIRLWARLCQADALGCFPRGEEQSGSIRFPVDLWLDIARKYEIDLASPKPILNGRDLLPFGISPGPEMGHILKKAFEAQLDGEFDTFEGGIEWLQKNEGFLEQNN